MNFATYIFLIHGLGGTTYSLQPLKTYLTYYGYENVHLIEYKARTLSLEKSIYQVNKQMDRIIKNKEDKPEIALIGQSLGGLICHQLHLYGWNIAKSITIGSPHHGSSLLYLAKKSILSEYLSKPIYKDLLQQNAIKPPHDYHTISTSIIPFWNFDGQVYIKETMIESNKHTHIPFNNHWTIFIDPRLLWKVSRLLQ